MLVEIKLNLSFITILTINNFIFLIFFMNNSQKKIVIVVASLLAVWWVAIVSSKYLVSRSTVNTVANTETNRQYRNASRANRRKSQSQKQNNRRYTKNNGGDKKYAQWSRQLNLENSESVDMTEKTQEWLLLMREEEKLARDVYRTLGDTYNLRVFANIEKAEQQHMDAVWELLKSYTIQDPIVDDSLWKFTNDTLQKLYNDLVEKWSKSIDDAIQVGIEIEELDIADLERLVADLDESTDIYKTYQYLLDWSKRHLDAFQRQIK